MMISSIVSATAFAMVVGLGSASAADQFTTLADVEAQTMTSQGMGEVRGGDFALDIGFSELPGKGTGFSQVLANGTAAADDGLQRAQSAIGFDARVFLFTGLIGPF